MDDTKPVLGVIEGFFGRDWGWDARIANFPILAREGVDLYVYAPKSDRFLRQDWRKLYAPDQLARLLGSGSLLRYVSLLFGPRCVPEASSHRSCNFTYYLLSLSKPFPNRKVTTLDLQRPSESRTFTKTIVIFEVFGILRSTAFLGLSCQPPGPFLELYRDVLGTS